jgi:predicted RNase H-like HicB family nuclease
MSLTEQPEISNEPIRDGTKSYHFSVIIEKDQDGYFAFCPELQGCYTQGYAYEEVLGNIRDVIRLHVEDRLESGEEIPQPEYVSMTSMDVAM